MTVLNAEESEAHVTEISKVLLAISNKTPNNKSGGSNYHQRIMGGERPRAIWRKSSCMSNRTPNNISAHLARREHHIRCKCGKKASIKISLVANVNHGREFACCVMKECDFWTWVDLADRRCLFGIRASTGRAGAARHAITDGCRHHSAFCSYRRCGRLKRAGRLIRNTVVRLPRRMEIGSSRYGMNWVLDHLTSNEIGN